jgi:hypothetical protein
MNIKKNIKMDEKKGDEYWFITRFICVSIILLVPYYILYTTFKLFKNGFTTAFDIKMKNKVYTEQ